MSTDKKMEIGRRIAALRSERHVSQEELALSLSEIMKRGRLLSVPTVSSWETGRRKPGPVATDALAEFFHVSKYYILCTSNDRNATKPDDFNKVLEENSGAIASTERIQRQSLSFYHQKPLFLTFHNQAHLDQWALYDANKEVFVTTSFVIKASSDKIKEIYSFCPYITDMSSKPIGLRKLMELNEVFIRMATTDSEVKAVYDGWYTHDREKRFLINKNGFTLPYEGLNLSYYAYGYRT